MLSELKYTKSSTMLIIGGRGVGKSTLAVITAIALRRKFIDIIATFESQAGITAEEYALKHGIIEYRHREYELLQTTLLNNSTNCVISCSSQVVEEPSRSFLIDNLSNYPIIHITRNEKEVRGNFHNHRDLDKILLQSSTRISQYRRCSNFEFANLGLSFLDESDYQDKLNFSFIICNEQQETPKVPGSHKTAMNTGLKKLEHGFLYFIKYIFGDTSNLEYAVESAIQRPWKPVEGKGSIFTRSLLLPFYDITTSAIDFDVVAVGIDAIELRIDMHVSWALRKVYDPLFYVASQISYVRSKTNLPIIYNFSKTFFDLSYLLDPTYNWNAFYVEILYLGLRLNVEYMIVWQNFTLPATFKAITRRKHHTKIISEHAASAWDPKSIKKVQQACKYDQCDLIKITSYAVSLQDNFSLFSFIDHFSNSSVPLIAFNNGPLGKMSRCMNKLLSPVESEILFNHSSSFYKTNDVLWTAEFTKMANSDLLSISDVNGSIHSLFIVPKLQFYHFGQDSTKKFSSVIYAAAFASLNTPHQYTNFESTDISDLQTLFQEPNFGGGTVSQPFKMQVLDILDSLSLEARLIGAVNMIKTIRDPETMRPVSFHGDNTDWKGIHNSITKHISARNSINSKTNVVVIGAGGTARAGIYSLIRLGVRKFYVYNRTQGNAAKMISHFKTVFSMSLLPALPVESSRMHMASSTVESLRFGEAGKSLHQEERVRREEREEEVARVKSAVSLLSLRAGPVNDTAFPRVKRVKTETVASLPKLKGNGEYGTLSFQRQQEDDMLSFKVLDSLNTPWVETVAFPTMIFNFSTAEDLTIHESWFNSPTGGIGVEVSDWLMVLLGANNNFF